MSPPPIYRRPRPVRQDSTKAFTSTTAFIDLTDVHLPPFGPLNTVEQAALRFDGRAAAAVSAAVGLTGGIVLGPAGGEAALLEEKYGGTDEALLIPTAKCLAVLGFPDYFPDVDMDAHLALVSRAIETASPGWCGSFGPDGNSTLDAITKHEEGNYDMSQMHLVRIAYRYYDRLTSAALDHLVEALLPGGRIRRPNENDEVTSGGAPVDWSRAGVIEIRAPVAVLGGVIHPKVKRIGETENHILTIHTARYLANQLLYQRHRHPAHDNRRNGFKGAQSCTSLMLSLLRNILRDDFSEYNAKNYQNEVRSALLNLCDFAYDHEVRLAARMVLDYVSAHVAVSSNDLRRLVPFRRRNQGKNVTRFNGHMLVGLLSMTAGADPLTQRFAILAGNTRAYEAHANPLEPPWSIKTNEGDGNQAAFDALSDYRLPPLIHDLFVTDEHRRFFQRLHRTKQDDPDVTGRNCDNFEIFAGSPSYLITAGGSPAPHAIDAKVLGIVFGDQTQQLGVALPTSFMPTGTRAGPPNPKFPATTTFHENAANQIQLSAFSSRPGEMENYGVAPDFLCGMGLHAPPWCVRPPERGQQSRRQVSVRRPGGRSQRAGFLPGDLR